jgi:hypothetical protein
MPAEAGRNASTISARHRADVDQGNDGGSSDRKFGQAEGTWSSPVMEGGIVRRVFQIG